MLDSPLRACRTVVAGALLLAGGAARPAAAQDIAAGAPDPATLDARYEEAFQAALELPADSEPLHVMQTWGAVILQALMAERVRAAAAGADPSSVDGATVTERVLVRWQELRPAAGGPELFRTFPIRDAAEKRAAVVALSDRFPDDPLVVWQATQSLLQGREPGRAAELAETFLARNPDHPLSYRSLFATARDSETRQVEVLHRWARARPGDPAMVSRLMASVLPRRDPEATDRVLSVFFAGEPAGGTGLEACLQVVRSGDGPFAGPARACVARIAGDPDAPPQVAERATAAMAGLAAGDGDWSAMLAALEALPPEARVRALTAAARRVEAPARCGEAIELLAAAAEALADDDGNGFASVASASRACADAPAAEALFLDLLRRAPADRLSSVLGGRVTKVNGIWRGALPAATTAILEGRLDAEPGTAGVFHALDTAYLVADARHQRLDLLRRWHRQAPVSMRAEQVTDLAWALVASDEAETAAGVLEQHLESRFQAEVAEALHALYSATDDDPRAARFAASLTASADRLRARTGHTLAARAAVERGDLASAEAGYWQALEGEHPRKETAVELLSVLAWKAADGLDDGAGGAGGAELEATARRICRERELLGALPTEAACAADLLTRAGSGTVAAGLLAARAENLPDDLPALRQLAASARAAGQPAVEERALSRIVELDPLDESGWVGLGRFFELQGRADDAAALLVRARRRFALPPSYLSRAVGRALTAAGRHREAIEILLESRAALADTAGGDWSRSWIDHELRAAYRGLGEQAQSHGAAEAEFPLPTEAGEPCDAARARLERDAADGRMGAAADLGKALLYGHGDCVAAAPPAALPWLEAGAAADRPGAAYDFALASLLAAGNDVDHERGLRQMERLASRPDPLAVETLAFLVATGWAMPRDTVRAADLLAEAARLGSDAFPRLRQAAERSPFVRWILDQGSARLATMTRSGDAPAAALLARLSEVGVARDIGPERRLALARSAAEAGEPMAMRVLRNAYRDGNGVEADRAQALAWQQRCAEAGNAFCMMFLGNDLIEGEDLPRDVEAGMRWLRRAAEAGNWWAIGVLGRRLDAGRFGIARDAGQAAAWKRRLAELGDPEAAGWLLYHSDR